MENKSLKIVFSVVLKNAGDATRSLEIAKGIREYCPSNYTIDIIFLSRGSKFDQKVIDDGFTIYQCEPRLSGAGFREDFKTERSNFIGDEEIAYKLLKGEIEALQELQPDLIFHGFWPFANIARKMLKKPIASICFMPIPLDTDFFASYLVKDVPDNIKLLTCLPLSIRHVLMKAVPKSLKLKAPFLHQRNIELAMKRCGFTGQPFENLCDMLRADLTVINDLKEFYEGQILPANFKIVGPLFSPGDNNAKVDPNILNVFSENERKTKVFCTMGSSGTKEQLLEVIKALTSRIGSEWNAVVLAPSAVCPLEEALAYAGNRKGLYITDKFVPAPLVNGMADVVICHGGQGTVQTALASGTPIVGVAMQPEQQINLDNIALNGAGIRIPITRWTANNIAVATKKLIENPSYSNKAKKFQMSIQSVDGKKDCAIAIWDFIKTKLG